MDKGFSIGIVIFILVAIGVVFLGFSQSNTQVESGDYDFESMPEECRLPPGQDVNSWIEHLSHHSETKYCLDYYK